MCHAQGPATNKGLGGLKTPIHFHCILHAKKGWVGSDSMSNCVCTKWKAPQFSLVVAGLVIL